MLADSFALVFAGVSAFLLWAAPVHNQPFALYLPAAIILPGVVLGFAQAGLYPGFGLGPVETFRRYSLVTFTAFLTIAALVLLLKLENSYSRVTLGIAFVLSWVTPPLLRAALLTVTHRWTWWPEPVVVAARPESFDAIGDTLRPRSHEFEVVGFVDLGALSDLDPHGSEDSDVVAYARAGVRVVIARLRDSHLEEALDRLRALFPRVVVLRDFNELPVEGVQVRNLGGVLGLEYTNNLLRWQSRWVKRSVDIAVATATLLASLPLIAFSLLAVKTFSPGPALFWQTREGRHGRLIRVPKIRTMVLDAERRMEDLFLSDPSLREEWQASFKLRRDPRIIPVVGVLFRRFSIDELPQLWSVVKGDMSLVGPRPFPQYHLDALSPQARRLRNEVRPGITGMWQVTARGTAGVEAQQSHDVYYIRNWSVWLDIYILARTAGVVLSGRGAY